MVDKGLNVLITGATSGIGEALALYYAENGAKNLFICGRNAERLQSVKERCEKLGIKVYAEILDVKDREKDGSAEYRVCQCRCVNRRGNTGKYFQYFRD